MLLLRIVSLLLIPFFLFAFKIYGTKIEKKGDSYYIQNPLILYKDNTFIQAQKGIIEKNHIIKLFNKVNIFYQNENILLGNSLTAYSKNKITLKNIFFYSKEMNAWVKSLKALSKNNSIYFNNLYFSTCCIEKPDWFMKASSGKFNRKDKILQLHNLVLILHNVPVFYLPYLRINFNKQRRSGLLRPYVGYSNNEGLLYSQPIYFATSVNTDLEITPTFRNLRGRGIYSTFRFVDSPDSKGSIKIGEFIDKEDFYKNNNLANKKHYGYSFYYRRDKIFSNDKLYMNLKYANDVDFFYLNPYNYKFDTSYLVDKIVTSNINYINVNKNFYGIYFKYFIDTSLLSNDLTWQILPQINYHKFLDKKHNILYSFDFNAYNYYRKTGSNFAFSDIYIPISYYKSFSNDFVKFKVSENLYAGYGKYYQQDSNISKYLYLTTQFKIYTSLAKSYETFDHIISPSLSLNIKNYSQKDISSDLVNVTDMQNSLFFNLYEMSVNNDLNITHILNQTYYLDNKEFSDLENKIILSYLNYTIDEDNRYSVKEKEVNYNNIKFGYNNKKIDYFISHIYQKDNLKSIILGGGYKPNIYKRYYFEYSFDLINKYIKYWLLGVKMQKKCYKYSFSFKQNRIPVLENSGINYKKDNIISLSLQFYPIGGVNQSFVFKGKE